MRCRLVKAGRGRCRTVHLYLRCGDGSKRRHTVRGYAPYFYVPSRLGAHRSLYGEPLQRVEAPCPEDVPRLREQYHRHYEADVPYARRFLIDHGIRDCVEYDGSTVRPAEGCGGIELRRWLLDIEVHSPTGFPDPSEAGRPVVAVTVHDSYLDRYHTLAYIPGLRRPAARRGWTVIRARGGEHRVTWTVEAYPDEESLLLALQALFDGMEPDVVAGWNIGFDVDYLANRAARLGVELRLDGAIIFDMLEAYRRVGPRQRSYALKEVTVAEGIEEREEARAAPEALSSWPRDPRPVLLYNLRDVWRLAEIERRHGLIDYYLSLKSVVGLEDLHSRRRDGRHGLVGVLSLVDTAVLRTARLLGVALPSSRRGEERRSFRGAIVLEPVGGVHEGVAVFDMSKYYPALIISFNISPETKDRPVNPAEGIWRFKAEPEGLLPRSVRGLLEYEARLREEQARLDPSDPRYADLENKIAAVKAVRNSFYGVMGNPHFRLFDVDVASTITGLAREGILYVVRRVAELGHRALYGDTDSVFIKVPLEDAPALADRLTRDLRQYFMEKYGLPREPELILKFEKYYARIFFKPRTKKRYAGLLVWKKGKHIDPPSLDITGFEAIRTDVPPYSAEVQRGLLRLILEGASRAEIARYVAEARRGLREHSLYDIALVEGISKPLDQYRVKTPPVRAALYGNLYLGTSYAPGDKVHYVYVRRVRCRGLPATDVAPVTPELEERIRRCFEIDWRAMEEKVVDSVVRVVLEPLGMARLTASTDRWW